jgi:hypothetical protein
MKPNRIEVVTPKPYYKISFGCSHRNFYEVKNELWDLFENSSVDDDFSNGYFSEKCDYEGDLEEITIYNNEKIKPFIKIVLDYYGGSIEELGNMDLVLSIF